MPIDNLYTRKHRSRKQYVLMKVFASKNKLLIRARDQKNIDQARC